MCLWFSSTTRLKEEYGPRCAVIRDGDGDGDGGGDGGGMVIVDSFFMRYSPRWDGMGNMDDHDQDLVLAGILEVIIVTCTVLYCLDSMG